LALFQSTLKSYYSEGTRVESLLGRAVLRRPFGGKLVYNITGHRGGWCNLVFGGYTWLESRPHYRLSWSCVTLVFVSLSKRMPGE